MTKKIFVMLIAAILIIPCAVFAKKKELELPESKRVKIAVEVTDATNFTELQTFKILRDKLIVQFAEKKIFSVVGYGSGELADIKTLENKGASDVGDIVAFNTKDLPFEKNFYRDMGAQYVIRCEILGIGTTMEDDDDFGFGNGIGIGVGSGGEFGVGVFGGVSGTLRTFYCTAVNMQMVEVESGAVIARKNFVGKSIKRKKPKKGYDDASDEAYLKSLGDAAKTIVKRVSTFTEKNILNSDNKK